jgi:hypothetical protein
MNSSVTTSTSKWFFLALAMCVLFALAAGTVLAQTATNGDYRSAGTGNWNTAGTWQVRTAGSWAAAASPPTSANNVYIQSGHTVTVNVATAACNDFHQHTAGVTAVGANTLQINGKIRAYTGTAVITTGADGTFYSGQTSSSSPGANSITTTGAGKVSFVGNTRSLTLTGEWGATLTGAAFDVSLTSGQTGTPNTNMKASSWTFTSGTVDANSRTFSADDGTNPGNVTVASGATILSSISAGKLFQRTASGICGTVTVNGKINFSGAAPTISATTIAFNGTIEYSANGAQTFVAAAGSGAAVPLAYTNLILSGSGAKTTLASQTTTIAANGSLTMSGGATPATFAFGSGGAFSVSATGTTLSYTAAGAQTTGPEWVANFQNVNVNNSAGISLDASKTVNGTLTLATGTVTTGANTLTLGASGTVSRTSGYVVGNFAKNFGINDQAATVFEVGTASAYTPVTLDLDGTGGTAGTFTATTTGSAHGSIATSGLNTAKDIERYWTVSPGTGLLGARTYKLKVDFLAGDVTGGADPNIFEFRKYDGVWTTPSGGSYTRTGTSTQYSNFTSFSDYAVGEMAPSTSSDIIANVGFTYPANIDYAANTGSNVTSGNPEVFRFDIRDGGGSADADAFNTTLTDITFSVANSSALEKVALYDNTTELAEVAAGSSITFSGLSATAADGGSKTLNLRATYKTSVTDNTQFSFTVTSATSSGSGFAAGNAGGATSSTSGDNNRIEVTASKLAFTTQPSTSASIGIALATQPVVAAQDANNNTDLDYSGTVTLTNSGSIATSNNAVAATSGVATYSGFRFNAAGAGITLSTTNGDGLTNAPNSNAITITCPTITLAPSSPLPNGTATAAYSQTITASGGTGPYGFAVTGGALPTGLTLASGGGLTGTPTVTGAFSFTVTATDAFGCTGSLAYALTIDCPVITLSPPTLLAGLNGIPYSQTVSASGGVAPYSFTSSGTLPTGLSLSGGGVLSGTPTANGNFTFHVIATDANGCKDSLQYTVAVGNCPVATVASPFPDGSVGAAYSHTIAASGGVAPYTYAHTGGTLPPGLTFTTNQLSGTPTTPGKFVFAITIQDSNLCTTVFDDTVVICGTITLAPASPLANGTAGSAYAHTITASGSSAPYTFAVTGGALPAGLSLASGGGLTGTPTVTGAFSFTVTATDTFGCTGSLAYALTIDCPVLTLSPPTLPSGLNGIPYSQTVSASGGFTPYTFTTNGTLPTGLTLSGAGLLSGTPTANGNYTFYVVATDSNGCKDSLQYSITIGTCPVATVASPFPDGSVGASYAHTIAASGGVAPYTYTHAGGTLPPGLTFTTDQLSGTPTTPGKYAFEITIQDANLCTTAYYDTVVICGSITLAPSSPLANGTAGSAYSATITASGSSAPYTFAVTSGALPAGLTLASGGGLTGTPTVTGGFSFTVTATDANGCTGSLAYSLTIDCPVITLSPPSLPNGTTGSAYSQTISASGGIGSYAFSLSSGALPAGVTLASGGALSGTPTVSGVFNFKVRATDDNGCNDSLAYSLTVNCPTITLSPPTLAGAWAGVAYSQTISASGGVGPYTFTTAGPLPAGLTLGAGGALSGTPTLSGTYPFYVLATDANGCADSLQYTLDVFTCPDVTVGSSFPDGSVGAAYSHTIAASGGVSPYTYAHSGGTLPPGLTFTTDQLSGTPTTPGNYAFAITIQDANLCTTVYYDTVVICGTIALSPPTLPNGTAGSAFSQTIAASGSSAPYTFAITSGALPAGVTLASGGGLSGTPTVTGVFNFTVTATDVNGCAGSSPYSLTIDCPVISLSPPTLPAGTTGSAYSQTISASGGIGSYTFTLSSGALPAGVTLSAGGSLSGTPTVSGTFNFKVRATDGNGCSDSLAYSLLINCPSITVNPATLPNGFLSSAYSTTVTATGGTSPYTFANTGALPTGLTLASGGAITGTPTAAGTFVFTVTATDAHGCTGSRLDSITIFGAAVTSIASGNWNAGTTWNQGVKPGPTQNVVIAPGHTVTLTAADTCASVTVQNTGVLDISTFKLGLSGSYTLLSGAEGRQSAFNPVPGGGVTPWVFDPASTYTIGGSATGFSIGSATGITFGNMNWNSTANGTPPVGTVIAGNLTIGGTGEMRGGTSTTSRVVTVLGNVTINSGTLITTNSTSPATGGFDISGNLTVNSPGQLRGVKFSGAGTLSIGGSLINNGGKIFVEDADGGAGNWTVYFKGTGAGNFNPGDSSAFRSVAIAPGRTITLLDTLTVNATYALADSGGLFMGTNIVRGAGGFTMLPTATLGIGHPAGISTTTGGGNIQVTGTRTFPGAGTGSYVYNGSAPQQASDSTLFSAANLTINNAVGVTFINDFSVSTLLTLTSGNINMSAKTMSIGASGSVSRTSGHVIGKLSKNFGTGATVSNSYELGDGSAYTPVDLTLHGVATGGSLTLSSTAGEHPNLGTSGVIASKDVNRYYSVANSVAAFGTADATFHFVAGDVDAGANTANFAVGKYDAPNWSYPAVGTRTATSTQATGMTSFSEFAIGELQNYTITVTQGANGTISPGTTSVVGGATQHFSITPNGGFIVDSVFADGVYDPDSTTSYTFKNGSANHTLTAKFIAATFTITVTQGTNGIIVPGTSVVAAHANKSFAITPDVNYQLDSVMVDGARVDSATSYTFHNVRAAHTLTAKFSVIAYTVTVTQGAHGTIAPGTTLVPVHGSQAFAITPDAGYHVDSVKVDGAKVDSTTSYTFSNVTADHAITAFFSINMYTLTVNAVGGGTVGKAPDQATYAHGTNVSLTALPSVGWSFTAWSGDASGVTNPLGVAMTSNKTITATFTQDSSYLVEYRSFSPDSIALDKDVKGKFGKYNKRKADKVEFEFNLVSPGASTQLKLTLSMVSTGSLSQGMSPYDTLAWWTNSKVVTIGSSAAGDTFHVHGWGIKGKPIKVTYEWSTAPTHTKGTVAAYILNQPRLPMPNRVNALFESFEQSGFATTLGLLVGRDRTLDSAKQYGWLLAPKYTDVLKTLYVAKTGSQHSGPPKGLDKFLTEKPLVKRQKSIPPSKHNNALLAEMVAVKFNIVASAMEKIPAGFGELVYNDGTSNPLNGLMVKQIAALGDTMMMGYYAFGVHTFADSASFARIYTALKAINDAFEGPVDTLDFATKLHLKGVRPLASVPYLRAGTTQPAKIVPADVALYEAPLEYRLDQNYPNPFNPTTTISFELPEVSRVTLKVYNILGQQVAALLDNQEMEDGAQEVTFDANAFATGVYFYRLTAESVADPEEGTVSQSFTSIRKMMLIK